MLVSAIVAVGKHGEIGAKGKMPWPKLKDDMKWFVEKTTGKPVIMGRRTWDSLGGHPLKGRTNVVLTRDPMWHPGGGRRQPLLHEGTFVSSWFEDARVLTSFRSNPDEIIGEMARRGFGEAVVIGGATVYNLFEPYVDRVYLTTIDRAFPGADSFFYMSGYDETWRADPPGGRWFAGPDGLRYAIATYDRTSKIKEIALPPETLETQESIGKWAVETFPGGDPTSPRGVARFVEEVAELAKAAGMSQAEVIKATEKAFAGMGLHDRAPESPEKVAKEMADAGIVLDVEAYRRGVDLAVEKTEKMKINRGREWHALGDGTGYHIKPQEVTDQ